METNKQHICILLKHVTFPKGSLAGNVSLKQEKGSEGEVRCVTLGVFCLAGNVG